MCSKTKYFSLHFVISWKNKGDMSRSAVIQQLGEGEFCVAKAGGEGKEGMGWFLGAVYFELFPVRYHCGGWPEEVNTCFLDS